MSYSEVEICNLALSHVGIAQGITSLESESTEAQQCNLHYEPTRDLLLRSFVWPFARKFRALGLVTESDDEDTVTDWEDQWEFSYRYPSDCLRIIGFLVGNRRDPEKRPHELGADDEGQLIYCDEEDARIAYVSKITDPQRFPDDFAHALAWKLAARLAMPLTGRSELRAQAEAEFDKAMGEARVSALQEEQRDDEPDAEHIRARG